MAESLYFQWQNEVLCKTIYPMREPKLRDFLSHYMEIDIWKQYKDKNISAMKAEVDIYLQAQEDSAIVAYKSYNRSFIGYVPEGQVPLEHLKTLMDWNRVLRKKVS